MLAVACRGTGLAPLLPGTPASASEPMSHASQNSRGTRIVRFGLGMRRAALLLAVSALAMGGCGTLSGGLHSESMMAATATDPNGPIAAALAPEQQPSGAVVEPRAGEQAMAATLAFRPASFELI